MASGWRAVGVLGSFWCLGGCILAPPATPSPASDPAARSPAPPVPPAVSAPSEPSEVRVDISAAGVAIAREQLGTDPTALKAALGQADAWTLDVRATTDAPPSLVLAALTLEAGPRVMERSLTWQGLSLKVWHARPDNFGGRIPAALFSWRADGVTHLWSIDAEPAPANLGPYESHDLEAQPSVIAKVRKACAAAGCHLNVELCEEHLLRDLQAWQRLASAVGSSLELRVRTPPPPPSEPRRPGEGLLPPEVIQTVVRRAFPLFRACYEGGLSRDENLQGKILVSFVIQRDGTVKNTSDGGSDIPDAAVRDCVVQQFGAFKFPAPAGGTVTVVYPILLAPG